LDDREQVERDHWKARSVSWTATAAHGLSTDDTINQMLIRHAAILPGERILDVGSGTGDPAISIAVHLGGKGSVTACDLTPEMLAKARERAANVGLAPLAAVAADMAALPFADAVFDCVTCRFGLMFPGDRVAAAREALRVLKPDGRAAYVVWGPYEDNPPFYLIRCAVAAFLGEDEGPPSQRHSLGQPGLLEEILDAAGFVRSEERELRYDRPVDDLDDYIARGLRRGYAEALERLDKVGRDALMAHLRAAFAPFGKDGTVYMPNYARLGLGWKAG